MLILVKIFLKILILVNIYENLDFDKKKIYMKISILDNTVQKSQIWSKLSKNLDFGHDFSKFSILANTYQNVDFGRNWREFWF